jgi:hypothetical protein
MLGACPVCRDASRPGWAPNPAARGPEATRQASQQTRVPGLALAHATNRRGEDVAVRVRLAPGTDDAQERWLLVEDLVDDDPLDDVPG